MELYVDALTQTQILKLEQKLRPGGSSVAGFLGLDEQLKEIIHEDARTLRRLGVTHEQIATKLEQIMGHQLTGYAIKETVYRGAQNDPFQERSVILPHSNKDFTVTTPEGERIQFPGLMAHLIRNYQFFEGKGTPYRLDPERAIRVFGITS